MIEINIAALKDLVHVRRGAQFVTILTQTVPAMNKTGNPFWDKPNKEWLIYKRSWTNGMIGWDYANSVSNQRVREGHEDPDFKAQKRKWGTRIEGSPLVEHKGNYYLELKVEKVIEEPLYYFKDKTRQQELLDENSPTDKIILAQIHEWLTPSRQAATQETEKEIILRDYSIANILCIRINGQEYRVLK